VFRILALLDVMGPPNPCDRKPPVKEIRNSQATVAIIHASGSKITKAMTDGASHIAGVVQAKVATQPNS
jgi:hypothetical protein